MFYGTLHSEIKRLWEAGKHVLFDIDVQGGLNIKQQYPEQTLAVFVAPPSLDELEKRLRLRATETEAALQQRLNKSEKEMGFAKDFDMILVNDNLDVAKEEASRLVTSFLAL